MKTITITIPDPKEVRAALVAEFGDDYPAVSLDDDLRWHFLIWHNRECVSANGSTPEEAMSALRGKVSELDPANKLREEAKKLGMKLVPADE